MPLLSQVAASEYCTIVFNKPVFVSYRCHPPWLKATFLLAAFIVLSGAASAQQPAFVVERLIPASEAVQGVAADDTYVYAIANATIGKYDRSTGQRVAVWKTSDELPLTHLNAGLLHAGKLYCAHSNYPHVPQTSSVEIFAPETLTHLGNHSFGQYEGSLTWVDFHDGHWWAVFAHYSTAKAGVDEGSRNHYKTSLVQFDEQWRRLQSWVFPTEVLDRFAPNSCSGGFWGPDDLLYCTGHDHGEVYQLQLPRAGSTLVLKSTLVAEITGQGIAWNKSEPNLLFGIQRPQRQIVISRFPVSSERP